MLQIIQSAIVIFSPLNLIKRMCVRVCVSEWDGTDE